MKRLVALVLAAALAAPLTAQKKPAEPAPAPFVENIDVRVIDFDVVVTDKRGNFVSGLTKDDFEILENGVPKPISNFYEISGGTPKSAIATEVGGRVEPAPSAAPAVTAEDMKRRIIIYIDNLSLAPFNRNRVFSQMKEFLKTAMRPGDEAMVATYNRSMKVRVPFTRDANQVASILDAIASESGLGVAGRSERRQFEDRIRDANSYQDAIATARTYASSVEHDLRQSVSSINALMSTLAGVEGKKIMVLTSEGFPVQPGREVFAFVDDMAREKQWNDGGSSTLEGMHFDGTNLIQAVAKTANANDITMYTIHAAGLSANTEMSAEHARPTSSLVSHAALTNTTESMQMMAQMTGGLASTNTNNFGDAFKRIQSDLESYYSLGYRAGTERVDRQRYLQVRMKNRKDLRVRSRQTFVEKSVYAEMSDRVIANLLYRVKDNDLAIVARIGQPYPVEDGLFKVSVDIQIPMLSLTLLPQGEEESVGGFDVYIVVGNKDNDMSDVAQQSHQVRVPKARMNELAGKYYTYTLELLIERGLNKISLGVVDQLSNTSGFTREQIIAQNH
ncbi:MAG TPA: VWA domain-containing protein [Thermoanaerobaculia bacterium]|nr:VWA domain-containing protein [Thermoanaerobaculia bacterium]